MLAHPAWGPHIRQWRERGAVPRQAKFLACFMMAGSGLTIWLTPLPLWSKVLVDVTLISVGVWLCARPEPDAKLSPENQK